MSNFNELIKQKVEQFDVPYNEAHWAEMDGKLNKIHSTKIRNNSLITAGTVAVIAISSALYFNTPTDKNIQTAETPVPSEITINKTAPVQTANNNNSTTVIISSQNNEKDIITTNSEEDLTSTVKENNTTIVQSEPINENNDVNLTKIQPKQITPNAEFIVFNNQVCMGEDVSFEANEHIINATYFWEFGDGETSRKQNPNHTYKEIGKFDVSLTVTAEKSNLSKKYTEKNAAIILPQPKASFTYTETALQHDNNKLKYPYTTFKSKSNSKNNTYSWNFGNGKTSTSATPEIIYNKKDNFKVMLTVTNEYGCYNSTTQKVEVKNAYDLFAPNAFTPDNDGENDEFIPKALLGWDDIQFEMTITDLSNKVVYKTTDKNEPWEGRLNNSGSILPAGFYLWKVVTYDAKGRNHQHIGKVKILN